MAQTANNTHTTIPTPGMQDLGSTTISGTELASNITLTYAAAASTHYYARDLVLVDTTADTLTKCSGKASVFDGIVLAEVDNSSGAAGDLFVPVGVKGIFDFNGFQEATGETEDDQITFNDLVYLSADTAGVGAGQKVTALNASSVVVGRSLDSTTAPAVGDSDQNVVLRVYIDALAKSFS